MKTSDDTPRPERGTGRGRHGHGEHGGGHRVFGRGGLRLVLLQLVAEAPRHGYELIKAIEERLGGRYSPSPGVVYPTLTLLEEMGLVQVDAPDAGGRKRYTVTPAGQAHLQANRPLTDELMARMQAGTDGAGLRAGRPPQVMRAIENLKLAMRMRLARQPLDDEQAHAFAAVLDHAAQQIERI